ncbi:MAG: hypothetical protein WKF61_01470 [Luteimonas sp.]
MSTKFTNLVSATGPARFWAWAARRRSTAMEAGTCASPRGTQGMLQDEIAWEVIERISLLDPVERGLAVISELESTPFNPPALQEAAAA